PPRHAPRPTRRRASGWAEARPLGTPPAPSLPPPPRRYATPARREHPERSQSSARWRERCARCGSAWRRWRRRSTRSRRGSGRSARRSAIPRSTPMASVETQIHALEARLREIGAALGDPALYTDGERARAVTAERRRAEERVAWLMHEWEELSAAL